MRWHKIRRGVARACATCSGAVNNPSILETPRTTVTVFSTCLATLLDSTASTLYIGNDLSCLRYHQFTSGCCCRRRSLCLRSHFYLHSGIDAEESLERLAGRDRLQAGLGGKAVAEENRHVVARQEQIVGVVRCLSFLGRVCPRVAESHRMPPRGTASGTR